MLNYHIVCTVSLLLTFLLFLLVNVYIETKNLKNKQLKSTTNVLNIEQYTKFNTYLVQFNKSYKDDEYFTRLQNFRDSLEDISRLNKLDPTATHGLTKFSDMSREEFAKLMSMNDYRYRCTPRSFQSCVTPKEEVNVDETYVTDELPIRVDWRQKNVIGPVLDQKMCSSCWAISSVGLMEAMLAINTKHRVGLSVQEMLDCSDRNGCSGGNMVTALKKICRRFTSITTEDNYRPLTMVQGKCARPKTGPKIGLQWFKNVCDMNEDAIAAQIANLGPVAAVINGEPLKSYIGGIIRFSCHGSPNTMAHAIQIVGFDRSGDISYYIVKNSWGDNFGINGYVHIAMDNNVCGIADQILFLNVTVN